MSTTLATRRRYGACMNEFDVSDTVRRALDEALRRRGRVNILIAGKSGVGKSTLINAVFQGQMAETGQGRPVTKSAREITKVDVPVTLIDTRGLELEHFKETVVELEQLITDRNGDPDPTRHIHLAWLCIAEPSRRVEAGESAVAAMLAKRMPVVVVITKRSNDNGFRHDVMKLIPEAKQVVRVRAIAEEDEEGNRFLPKGLEELIDVSMDLVPEGHKSAFAAAQRVSVKQKQLRAHQVVASAVVAAGIAGATPIPFADAVLLVPIQIGMLAGVTAVFGLPLSTAFITTLLSAASGTLGATLTGRALAGGLLKLIPGGGTLAGIAIGGSTAALITGVLGEAYLATLSRFFVEDPDAHPSADEVARRFSEELTKQRG